MPLVNKDNFTQITKLNLNSILQGTVLSLALSIVFSAAAGLVYHFTAISDQSVPWLTVVVLAASSFLGSAVAGKNAGSLGVYHGAAVGIVFFFVILILGSFFLTGSAALGSVFKLLTTAIAGAIGGIVGVGLQ